MSTELTFAIPFHRGLDYLRIAVESVLAQREPSWRLLVCDDGGVEAGVEALVASYADERLSYLRNTDEPGIVGNWNRCLDASSTDLVTLLHADDSRHGNHQQMEVPTNVQAKS